MMSFVFFVSLIGLVYIYIGYPFLIFILGKICSKPVLKDEIRVPVTILIAAYNEERDIEATVCNKLEQDYPPDLLEVIVISDGSTDKTDEIVNSIEDPRVRLLRQEPRAGKTSALNMAVPHARGEILVFSDANSISAPDALSKLIQNFNDPGIGYVTGKMVYTDQDGTIVGDGCTAYMKYENFLRRIESRLGSVVGVDGGIDAVRKELYRPMNPDQLPDFVLPLKVVEQGYRVVYEPKAILKEPSLRAAQDEYKMRVRVSLRALWALWDMRHLLTFSPSQARTFSTLSNDSPSHLLTFSPSFLYSWQLWSHKLLRYLAFIFLLGTYFSNLALYSKGEIYKIFFLLQNLCYLAAFLGAYAKKGGHLAKVLYPFNYFVLLNLASAHAFIKFLLRQKQVIWTPRKG
ncbi:MAG: glycosyltransferase family 2 protein [Deltaproteobacteria bacterium]|nr:MAG: glycosyltransferase family 2 protein [Deltaproteobacteria bacterium]